MTDFTESRTAPFYTIPARRVVSVEHPAIIKNVDKALDTLRGEAGITRILNPPKADSPARLFLRPEDAMSRPMKSISSTANNILVKVTVPKRTGRKRKKGSDEPFTGVPITTGHVEAPRHSAREVLQSLRDNVGRYQFEPVGMIERTHVFRGMPDFVFSTASSAFANKFRDHILPFDYERMKQFDLDMTKGITSNVDIIPPPSFSHGDLPFNYIYRQNPTMQKSIDTTGKITTVNTQRTVKVHTHLVPYDIPEVPTQPRDNCPPISTLDPTLQETITILQGLFSERPAWTRRGLRNALPTVEKRYALRHAIPYVGYVFRSGPWRDAIIRFSHDPRSSPENHIYQTLMFQIQPRDADVARDGYFGASNPLHHQPGQLPTDTHLFTGQPPLARDGRMWMYCDIQDPILRNILFPAGDGTPPPQGFLRDQCDVLTDGWYGNGTLAKFKTIMRHKVLGLLDDRATDDAEFEQILTLPDFATPESINTDFWLDPATATSKSTMMATEIRAIIKSAPAFRERAAADKRAGKRRRGRGMATRRSAAGRRVQFREDEQIDTQGMEVGEEMGEGEEEAYEQEELLEAQAAEAAAAVSAAVEEDEDEADEDDDEGESEQDEDIDTFR
ncbi:RNA polymerase III transcription factor IIIC subunit [Aspergillus indologenus CBS 114.80]|uniref:RNA polymerase III transcription factor IIIC subunit n=1 Tax=Aspergillus indologenus CBS 114.80 TaxID=1450541 RepID=A0A2V5IGT2_9EURO|nr:RNA polymerase III transcription factor IIIC subunit [Aspergillus indologenus CBS 114.80]